MTKPNSIICHDSLKGLSQITSNSVHLIVTSPPFNVRIAYTNHSDNLPHSKYLSWMKTVWINCYRVLVDGGRICINIDSTVNLEKDKLPEHFHPLHVEFTNQLIEIGYIYRGEICWKKQNVCGKNTAWGSFASCSCPHIRRNHEYIVIASKGKMKLDGDSMKCDLTPEEFQEWTLSEWRFSPATSTNAKGHPASFPEELPKRCIKLFSYVGNIVLDPFNGIGTTTLVASKLGRSYIGIDNSSEYCQIARERMNKPDIFNEYKFEPAPLRLKRTKKQKGSESGQCKKRIIE